MLPDAGDGLRLFLCGDVMLGRGIDCIMPRPGDPLLHEEFTKSALDYLALAERKHGPIPKPADYNYVWGDGLADLERENVAARIVNLETSITVSDDFMPKGINYRMHPANIRALTTAKIDCCALANNHVLDWGAEGLKETLQTLKAAKVRFAGAGMNISEASAPAIIPVKGGRRIVVFSFALRSSGIPSSWAAGTDCAGVWLLEEQTDAAFKRISEQVTAVKGPQDVLIASIHWGDNWGYRIVPEQRALAHRLVDAAGFHVVHGHSSHHAKAIEVHRGHLIIYGCGDFITDYEGISGYQEFRGDLAVAYLPELSPRSELVCMKMLVYRLRKFRLESATLEDTQWLEERLNREGAPFGVRVNKSGKNILALQMAETAML